MADWNKIYEEKFNESTKGFDEQRKQYEAAQAAEQASLDRMKQTSAERARKDMEDASRQAYISRVMAEKNLPQLLAAQGISGGMTETTRSNLYRDYLGGTGAARASYDRAMSDLENGYASDSAKLKTGWAQKQADLDQQQRNQAMEQAKLAYQIAVQEEERRRLEEERRLQEEERQRREAEAAAAAARSTRGKGGTKNSTEPPSKKTVSGGYNPYITKNKNGSVNRSTVYKSGGKTYYSDSKGKVHTVDRWNIPLSGYAK